MKNRLTAGLHRLLLLNYRRTRRLFWELRAADVDRLYGADQADYPTLRNIIARYHPSSVLDLGCGGGRLFPLYEEAGIANVLGVDISARALDIARRAHPKIATRRASVEDFTADKPYDMVVINRVLQHLPPETLAPAIANSARLAKRLIYLNEIAATDAPDLSSVGYMFRHDYPALFATQGWQVVEQGLIPGTRQSYLVLMPATSAQPPSDTP